MKVSSVYMCSGAGPGGGSWSLDPSLVHDVGFLTLGPELNPSKIRPIPSAPDVVCRCIWDILIAYTKDMECTVYTSSKY